MPVRFLPNKNLDTLEKVIINVNDGKPLYGEIDVYKLLYNEFKERKEDFIIWHDLKLAVHSESHNPYKKNEAQIDFLIVCKYGVCVLEVKGATIEYIDAEFYYNYNGRTERMKQNPLRQVEIGRAHV